MSAIAWGILAGALTGGGLLVGGMTHPSKIVGLLDFWGDWDPTGLLVMAAATTVFAAFFWPASIAGAMKAQRPRRAPIDSSLIGGAALFGIGWGLSGLCPGPAITALPGGSYSIAIYLTAMIAGMLVGSRLHKVAESARVPRGNP